MHGPTAWAPCLARGCGGHRGVGLSPGSLCLWGGVGGSLLCWVGGVSACCTACPSPVHGCMACLPSAASLFLQPAVPARPDPPARPLPPDPLTKASQVTPWLGWGSPGPPFLSALLCHCCMRLCMTSGARPLGQRLGLSTQASCAPHPAPTAPGGWHPPVPQPPTPPHTHTQPLHPPFPYLRALPCEALPCAPPCSPGCAHCPCSFCPGPPLGQAAPPYPPAACGPRGARHSGNGSTAAPGRTAAPCSPWGRGGGWAPPASRGGRSIPQL